MQLEESASCGFGGCDVDDVALDRGEIWVNPPNALGMMAITLADGVITAVNRDCFSWEKISSTHFFYISIKY